MGEPDRLGGLLRDLLGDRLSATHPIGPMTTYRVGGPARWFVEVADRDELRAHRGAHEHASTTAGGAHLDVLVLGNGSNLLVSDAGFDGLAIRLGEAFTRVSIDGDRVEGRRDGAAPGGRPSNGLGRPDRIRVGRGGPGIDRRCRPHECRRTR